VQLSNWLLAGADQASFVGADDRLDAISDSQFHEDAGDVRLDGGIGDDQLAGDLAVAHAGREEWEHFELSRGELVNAGAARDECRWGRELFDQAAGDAPREQRLTLTDRTYPGSLGPVFRSLTVP